MDNKLENSYISFNINLENLTCLEHDFLIKNNIDDITLLNINTHSFSEKIFYMKDINSNEIMIFFKLEKGFLLLNHSNDELCSKFENYKKEYENNDN